MKRMTPMNHLNRDRQGATIFLMLILLVIVFTFIAFAMDLGRVQLAQLKLQVASDFAARAGAEAMSRGVGDPNNAASHENAIRDEINMVMQNNTIFGSAVAFDQATQINFGHATLTGSTFVFTPTSNGSMDSTTDSIRVNPNLSQFPMLFGGFTGRDSISLDTATTAKVQDRDIVLVLDRSGSMFEHDAGTIYSSDYDPNLRQVEDTLYDDTSDHHPDNLDAGSTKHSEFVVSGGNITLSRVQALKLAVLKFRDEIDNTRANEKLGLTSYAANSSKVSDVQISHSGSNSVDIEAGLSSSVFDNITQAIDTSSKEMDCAVALENQANGYDDFDFQYLRMRCDGNTNIADGIKKGTEILFGPGHRSYATPILIVMTDGNHNQGSTPEAEATTAMNNHPELLIYTITFGTGAVQAPMITVANTGNGRHAHADNVSDLVTVFQDLATNAGVTVIE